MKKIGIFVAVLLLLCAAAPAAHAQATTLQVTEYQVTTGSDNHDVPIIGKDSVGYYIVYMQYPVVNGTAGNASIYYQRLGSNGAPTGSPVLVAGSSENQYYADAYGNYIVYTLAPSVDALGDIVLYSISGFPDGTYARQLTTTGDCNFPKIYGNYVIWLQYTTAGTQLLAYDLTTGLPVQATLMGGPIPSVSDASVGSQFFAWSEVVNGQLEIAAYDMQQGMSFMVSSASGYNEQNVSTYGSWITFNVESTLWNTCTSTCPPIGIQAISENWNSQQEQDVGTSVSVANNGAYNRRPNISGDVLAYESNVLGYYQIFLYRLAEGDTFQVTYSNQDEILNNVMDSLVAYEDYRSGSYNIYVSSFSFVSPPITATPSPVNFGSVKVGNTATQTVTLNVVDALTISNVQAIGDYSVTSNTCTPLPYSASANSTCTLQVQFAPSKPGQRWSPLVVTDSNNKNYSFSLEGIGLGSALAFTPGIISAVAGKGTEGYSGDGGPATSAELELPSGVAVDGAGNLYIADVATDRIRVVNNQSSAITVAGVTIAPGAIATVAGNGTEGYSGDGGRAISAELYSPEGVAIDSAGNLYIADTTNQRIRKVDINGVITTVAGDGTKCSLSTNACGDGFWATKAALNFPGGLAVDSGGNLYIADGANNRIRKLSPTGFITTVAGTGTAGFSGDGSSATSAELDGPDFALVDSAGNLYIADTSNNRVRMVSAATGKISTVAGSNSAGYSGDGGLATSAQLTNPTGLAMDVAGNLYIADYANQAIRKVDINGVITTVAGDGTKCSLSTNACGDGGTATSAELKDPIAVAVDGTGDLYIADYDNSRVRRVDVTTSLLTFGSLEAGQTSSEQDVFASDVGNLPLNFSSFTASQNFLSEGTGSPNYPYCTTTTAQSPGTTCTLGAAFQPTGPGNPLSGTLAVSDDAFNSPQSVSLSGIATPAPVSTTTTLNASSSSVIYGQSLTLTATVTATQFNNAAPTGTVTFFAGTTQLGQSSVIGSGSSAQATLNVNGNQLALGSDTIQAMYSGDSNYLSSSGTFLGLTTLAYGNAATLTVVSGSPQSTQVQTDFASTLLVRVADLYNNPVPNVTVTFTAPSSGASAMLQTGIGKGSTGVVASTVSGTTGLDGETAVFATANAISGAYNVTASVNSLSVNFALTNMTGRAQSFGQVAIGSNASITLELQFIESAPNFTLHYGIEFSAGTASCGSGKVVTCSIPVTFQPKYPGLRTDALVFTDGSGNVFQTTLLFGIGLGSALAFTPGIISTVAGNGTAGYTQDNPPVPATSAELNWATNLAMDSVGNLYIADFYNHRVRKVDAVTRNISTVAGTGTPCPDGTQPCGDGNLAINAELNSPGDVKVDGAGNIYIVDSGDNRVRKVDAVRGMISTVAGNGTQCPGGTLSTTPCGDGGPALSAEFWWPSALAIDTSGNLYIAEYHNARVRKVNTTGTITTVAGIGTECANSAISTCGDGGSATQAQLRGPTSVVLDLAGNLYIADEWNQRVRAVNMQSNAITVFGVTIQPGNISAVAGTGTAGFTPDNPPVPALSAELNFPSGVAMDSAGNLYITDQTNNRVRKVDALTLNISTVAGDGTGGYNGDGGPATSAELSTPNGVMVDSAGNLYIADWANSCIRKVDVTTSTLSFGSLNVGQTSTAQTINVSDVGTAPLNFSAFNAPTDFKVQNNNCTSQGTTLALGATCTFGAVFAPTIMGSPLAETLTVSDDAFNSPQKVALSGIATGVPVITWATPAAITYGTPLSATQLDATANVPGAFAYTPVAGTVLGAGTYTLNLTFTPTDTTDYTTAMATVTLAVNPAPLTIMASSGSMVYGGPVYPVTASYSGFVNGDTPASLTTLPMCGTTAISASPVGAYISYCSGASDPNYTITTPYPNGAVAVTQATTTTAVVSSDNPSTYIQLVTFTATVTPQYAGTVPTGTVTFYNNGASIGTATLSLASCGTPPCPDQASFSTATLPDSSPDSIMAVYSGDTNFLSSTSPAITQTVQPTPIVSLNPMFASFGNQNVNTTSLPAPITLTNIGDATLNMSANGISISGANAGEFAQTNNCGSTLTAGNSCTINVTFTPMDTGVATAALQITDNDDNTSNAQQLVSLTGSGLSTIVHRSLFGYGIFATAPRCDSIMMSGGSTVDSFDSSQGFSSSHQLSGGNVGTNGNVTLRGSNTVIYGTAATGGCGATWNGEGQVNGGLVGLNGQVIYAVSTAPNSSTTPQNISGSCGSISGCTNIGNNNVSLAPGQYGNLSINAGTTTHFSAGTYNINSLILTGNSNLYVDSGPVLVNLAGASLPWASPAMDLAGGNIQNPSGMPANLQFTYGGSQGVNLSGGPTSYATVYAPNALVNISRGSDFFGAIVGSIVTNSGGTKFHYDRNLPNILAGNYIWFNAVVNNVRGLPSSGQVKLYLTDSTISFTTAGTSYSLSVPNGVITFNSSSVQSPTTTYDLTNSRWNTQVPAADLTGNTFVTGLAFLVPINFPSGIQNVKWSAAFTTDTPAIKLQWQWAAAVYTSFSTTYATGTNSNVLGVNAEDGSADTNGFDPAGTPESYKASLIFGATGCGWRNYIGFFSPSAYVIPTVAPMSVSPSGLDFGTQAQGTTSATLTAILTNNDSSAYTISSISIGGANAGDFSFSPTNNNCPLSPNTLASGASCAITVTFTPSDIGTRTGEIAIKDNAKNTPQTVYLTGTGQ